MSSREVKEDVWIPTACSICFNQCSIIAHRVDGRVVKIEGNPNSPLGLGRLCPKGLAGIMHLYDPNRVDYPLKRTNPEKGIGVDGKFVRMSWDEAWKVVTEKFSKVKTEDPRKLVFCGSVANVNRFQAAFMATFGSPNSWQADGHMCGHGEHHIAWTWHNASTTNPDLQYCNYLIILGCGHGFHSYYAYTTMAQYMSDARVRGMKLVVVDPYMNIGAAKADEWVPIRPGTDAALACGMMNVLINELGVYDREHLKHGTNGPYLIGIDGRYLRDRETSKPLMWDLVDNRAKTYDDPSLKDPSIEGAYTVNGVSCKPSFQLLKEKMKAWTPERCSEITTIPANTIRRLAKEFGDAARVGSTIAIEGVELPYRPVSLVFFKGVMGHDHAWLTALSLNTLMDILGAGDVPGSNLGTNGTSFGTPWGGTLAWGVKEGPDGIVQGSYGTGMSSIGSPGVGSPKYPFAEPKKPEYLGLNDLYTMAASGHLPTWGIIDPNRYGISYQADLMFNAGSNIIYQMGDPKAAEAAMKKLFVINYNAFIDESAEGFADIILPDASYLERLDPFPNMLNHHHPNGMGEWGYVVRQPVIEPMYERKMLGKFFLELAEKIGMFPELLQTLNGIYSLHGKYLLDTTKKYTLEEISDTAYRCHFGDDRGLEFFKKNGLVKWKKKVEEMYWGAHHPGRIPIYFEQMVDLKGKVDAIIKEHGLKEFHTDDFEPLAEWKACANYKADRPEYDLTAIYYRIPWHQFSYTFENPWLDEISMQLEPWSYFIVINKDTADRKGLKDGDEVWLEAQHGGRTKGRVKLAEGMHPEVVGIANNGGHWSRHMPVAKGKGVFFEALLNSELDHSDFIGPAIDCDAKIKIYKA